ncbi:hypothetical protein C8E03_108132 [Lachnotalea glycerini]|uniref:Hydrolase n=1 Tax=Lachnotalea glycerini TaxID=1763509 RepID=A0A318EK24_9FIRM|nr:hypothetical protein [Lachnotalea glycerini]OYO76087.1 hypothetical protein CG709_16335 [Lachnotalea glycerini]PXV88405.1 hypothetical protein C8E03_108132 [Lachnotalea glycerini]
MSRNFDVIAVDFDGTLCVSEWPEIGEPNKDLIRHLKFRKLQGDKLILWTCRCEERLTEAVEWCKEQGLEFDAVNENLPELIALFGGNPRKICADIYIDDKNSKVQHLYKVPFLGNEE